MPSIEVKKDPFPHAVMDGWWNKHLLKSVLAEFKAAEQRLPEWKFFRGPNERKAEGGEHLLGFDTRTLFRKIGSMAPMLEDAFELPKLSMELIGGGYHRISEGGLLNVHTDFNRSPVTGWHRRINLLVYLNHGWKKSWGGVLELWDDQKPRVEIVPEFNRTVIFVTSDHSWHGHPVPVAEGRVRRSVAAYFYSEEPPPDYDAEHDTVWHPRA